MSNNQTYTAKIEELCSIATSLRARLDTYQKFVISTHELHHESEAVAIIAQYDNVISDLRERFKENRENIRRQIVLLSYEIQGIKDTLRRSGKEMTPAQANAISVYRAFEAQLREAFDA